MADFIDKIVEVVITRQTITPSMASFSEHLVVDAFDPSGITPVFNADHRVHKFGSLTEITEAGFATDSYVYRAASKQFSQNPHIGTIYVGLKANTDANWTAALSAIKAQNNEWYGLSVSTRIMAEQQLVAQWVQANEKLGCLVTGDPNVVNATAGDIGDFVKTNGLDRVIVMYHPDAGSDAGEVLESDPIPEAALFGLMFTKQPGSPTWKFKQMASVPTYYLTEAQYTNAKNKNVMIYPQVSGVATTMEGKTGGGEYIDVIHGCDWLKARIQNLVFTALVRVDKVPFTDRGILQVVSPIRQALNEGVNYEILASFDIQYPKRAEVSTTDRGNRHLPNITFEAPLAGAIHSTTIKGTITV